jgi:hypothetical protein
MDTANIGTNGAAHRRSRARRTGLALGAVLVCLAGCSDDSSNANETVAAVTASSTAAPTTTVAPTTTAAPTTTDAPTTTVEVTTTDAAAEVLVFEGTLSDPNNSVRTWQGDSGLTLFSNSLNLDEGDLGGNGAFFGYVEGSNPLYTIKGDWVFNVTSPELGEGVLAVQNWEYVGSETDGSGTGDVIGLSGGFTDLVGTISYTVNGGSATYVIELQRMEPAPTAAEPIETMTIDLVSTSTSDIAWRVSEAIVGGGATLSGDIVGSASFRTNDAPDDLEVSLVGAGTLVDEGDGTFIVVLSFQGGDSASAAWQAEFFGVSGAFAGLRGVGTAASTNVDATGAFAPVVTYNFEL